MCSDKPGLLDNNNYYLILFECKYDTMSFIVAAGASVCQRYRPGTDQNMAKIRASGCKPSQCENDYFIIHKLWRLEGHHTASVPS